MIDYLRGQVASLTPTMMVVDCHGVGYELSISLTTYAAYEGHTEEVKVWVSEIIREDAHLLYGFSSRAERELFGKLTTVSGVGPSIARLLLSQYAPQELSVVIMMGQADALKAVKGVGLKTAQRIIVDLKGKLSDADLGEATSGASTMGTVSASMAAMEEATSALKMLGFQDAAVRKVLKPLLEEAPTCSVEVLIKQALRRL